jgi:hypothetical protein
MILFHLALVELAKGDRQSAQDTLRRAEKLGLAGTQMNSLERERYERLISTLGVRQARRAA